MTYIPYMGICQKATFEMNPYANLVTSITDGMLEVGPELSWKKEGRAFTLTPKLRVPLTDKSSNSLQIDRFSSTWRAVTAFQFSTVSAAFGKPITAYYITGQLEYGHSKFDYYPTGNSSAESSVGKDSYAIELKYVGYSTAGKPEASQHSPQFRLRYAHEWIAADAVGVVNPPNANGVVTTTDLVIDAPGLKPTFSPAFAWQLYSGKSKLSYTPALYYYFTGKSGQGNPFDRLNRLRLEAWVFYYPSLTTISNVKIGISPFLSLRTKGMDSYNRCEYGALISLKFGTTFLQFL
jgi:hypothetical protein